MFNAEAIQEIKKGAISEIVNIEGSEFHKTADRLSAVKFPTENGIEVYSLSQLVSYIEAYEGKEKGLLVNIKDHQKVEVLSEKKNKNFAHDVIATADFSGIFQEFQCNTRHSQEDFIVQLQSRFVRDAEVDALLGIVSKITGGKTTESHDNGISQEVTVKAGVTLVDRLTVRPIWNLKPFKTFPEIEPVAIPYVLRLHQRSEEIPQFAMYEADGGLWKIKTTQAIKEWLSVSLKAETSVKVL